MKYLIVKADYNDADYVTEESNLDSIQKYCDYDVIDRIKKVVQIIKDCPGHNWDFNSWRSSCDAYYEGKLTEEDKDFFQEFVPSGGDNEVHTIESIRIIEISSDERLL